MCKTRLACWYLAATFHPSASHNPHYKIETKILLPICGLVIFLFLVFLRWKILRQRRQRQVRDAPLELSNRREDSNKSAPQTQGVVQNEAQASPAGAEVEGSSAGPVELDADQSQAAPGSPLSSVITARDLSPDSNPLHEPTGRPGSLYDPNLGAL